MTVAKFKSRYIVLTSTCSVLCALYILRLTLTDNGMHYQSDAERTKFTGSVVKIGGRRKVTKPIESTPANERQEENTRRKREESSPSPTKAPLDNTSSKSLKILSKVLAEDEPGLFSGMHDDLKQEQNLAKKGGLFDYLKGYDNPCWMSSFPEVNGSIQVYNSFLRDDPWGFRAGRVAQFQEFISNMKRRVDRGENWRLRCLPGVYLVGAEKCGTTDLIYQLTKNSKQLYPAAYKEARYWTPARLLGEPIGKYLDLFDRAADQIYNNSGRGLTIDGTPYHLYNLRWRELPGNSRLREPNYLLPVHAVHKLHPNTKIIIMVRNPVDRVYSLWRMHHDKEPLSEFHKVCNESITAWKQCTIIEGNSDRRCALRNLRIKYSRTTIYYIFIQEWMSVFGRDKVKVLISEEYYENRSDVLNEAYSFLGLDTIPVKKQNKVTKARVRNVNTSKRTMWNETRIMLEEFFEPYNRKLAELMKDDRFLWKM